MEETIEFLRGKLRERTEEMYKVGWRSYVAWASSNNASTDPLKSTKAVSRGVCVQDVKIHANWSLNPTTFETYYLKPLNRESTEAIIVTSNILCDYGEGYHIWKLVRSQPRL
jgi:hypothetical protein